RVTAAAGGGLAVLGSAWIIALVGLGFWWSELFGFLAMFALFFALFGWLAGPNQPRNGVVWIMAGSAVA
ncbi:MAG: hypothetical protein GWN07_21550, partial [Actinobacteria bacterium]|nr:hypothetical protein [Actinomycetota bacterium]NIS33057.1 hypothetical protein [Actinomycetota bacterium]NIU67986.1 hypothetical protein [Actinomycetota bacterium]NIV88316.1 hypothetical protein [Actinomycetota bacterium]NIW29776.1 hypothetical protein [Actinomycetota bacterium]